MSQELRELASFMPTLEQLMQDDSVRRLVNRLPPDIGKLHSLCHKHMLYLIRFRFSYSFRSSFSFSFSFRFRFVRVPILVRALVITNLLTNTLSTTLEQPPTPALRQRQQPSSTTTTTTTTTDNTMPLPHKLWINWTRC